MKSIHHHGSRVRSFALKPLAAALTVAGIAAGTTAPALAQGRSVLLEEVTVTAQKREEVAQDVGIAINVFSGAQLDQLGFDKSTDIALMTPGVHTGGSIAGQNIQFTIRGVTQNDFADHTESPIAVFIDDGYVAMPQGQNFALFDIDRVEVLKGPQSTLFGRNATGGLVQYVTRKPTFEPEGFVKAGVGDYDKYELQGAYGGPISDTAAFRVAGYYMEHDSILENDYWDNKALGYPQSGVVPGNEFPGLAAEGGGDDLWTNESTALRGHLLFNVGTDGELLLSANYFESEKSTGQYQSYATAGIFEDFGGPNQKQLGAIRLPDDSNAAAYDVSGAPIVIPGLRPIAGGDWFGYKDPDGLDPDHFSGDYAFDDLNEVDVWGLTANYEQQIEEMTFVSVTDWKEYEKFAGMDVDAAPMNQLSVWWDTEVSQFSQEFRLQGNTERMKWVTGFYYLMIDTESITGFKAAPGSGVVLGPAAPLAGADYPADLNLETNSYSIFGQVDYDLTDTLTLIAGLRLMQEQKDYDYLQYSTPTNTMLDFGNGPRNVIQTFEDDFDDDLWAGKVQLDWRATQDVLVYAGINRGIKAGSYNAPIDLPAPQPVPASKYDEEVLTSFEVGFKSEWWDGRTRINGAIYHYDYKDYQGFFFRGVSGIVVNNDAEVQGAELDITTSPIDGLDVMASAAYFDAEVEDVEVAPDVFRDNKPSFAPELQLSGLIRYTWQMFGGDMAAQYEVTYSDEFYYSLRNYDAHLLDSYTVQNVRVSYTTADEAWELAAFVDNVADERYATIGFDISAFCGCSEVLIGEPRWWGAEVTYRF